MLRQTLLIVVTAGIILFSNLGAPRLWDRDEPRNAGCAAEMTSRGDWVVPTFNTELRTHKPILLYWFIMAAYALFGVNEFAARFPSALLAVGSCLLTWNIGRRLFDDRVGLWAAVILASSLMFDVAGRAATPDSTLIFFSTLSIYLFSCGTTAAEQTTISREKSWFPHSHSLVAGMYAAMGFAVLAKGPIGMVLPTAVIGMYLLLVRLRRATLPAASGQPVLNDGRLLAPQPGRFQRCVSVASRGITGCLRPFAPGHFLRTCWSMRPVTAIVVVLLVALPWYALVGWQTDGAWTRGFFLEHNLGRATSAMEGHSGGIWFYPLTILIGFFPWSVFAVPVLLHVIQAVRTTGPWRNGSVLMACWVGVYVCLFTVAQTKLPSYITPCYPALALLTACFFEHWRSKQSQVSGYWPQAAFVSLGLVGVVMLVALPIAAHYFLPGEELLAAVGGIPLMGAVVGLWSSRRGQVQVAQYTMATTAVCLTTVLFAWAAVRVDQRRRDLGLLATLAQEDPASQLGAFGVLEPSWVFYTRRPVVKLRKKDSGSRFVGEFLQADHRYVITTRDRVSEVKKHAPRVTVLYRSPYFLKGDELIVLGRVETAPRLPGLASAPESARAERRR
ncbi:MAG: glycosyltransferase family 39 protein [Planctomycetota bacterium]|nr:glycosyltransferase family 39 protein [Planctomycetota bacterium]